MRKKSQWVYFLILCLFMPCFFAYALNSPDRIESPEELRELMKNPERVLFIDVRSEKEFNLMHIAGFQNMPCEETDWTAFEADAKRIVLICQSGRTAARVGEILCDNGQETVQYCVFGTEEFLDSVDEGFQEGYAICVPCRLKQLSDNEKEKNEQ